MQLIVLKENLMVTFEIPKYVMFLALMTFGCGSHDETTKPTKSLSVSTPITQKSATQTLAKTPPRAKSDANSIAAKGKPTEPVVPPATADPDLQAKQADTQRITDWLDHLSSDEAKFSAYFSAQNREPVVEFLRVHSPTLKRWQIPVDVVLGDFFDSSKPQQAILVFGSWGNAGSDALTHDVKPMFDSEPAPGITVVSRQARHLETHRAPIPITVDDGTTSVDSFKASVQITADQSLSELLIAHTSSHDCVAVLGRPVAQYLAKKWLHSLPVEVREMSADLPGKIDQILVFADFSTQLQINVIVRTFENEIPPRLYGVIQNSLRAQIDSAVASLTRADLPPGERIAAAQRLGSLTQVFDSLHMIADGELLELKIVFTP